MGFADHRNDRLPHPRDIASDLEALDGLLSALTEILDIREVFDRVSKVVQLVLPHDVMGVVEVNEAGDRCRVHAGAGLPTATPDFEIAISDTEMLKKWDALVLDDVQTHPFFRRGPAIDVGMKSVLSVGIRYGGRLRAGVNFFSKDYAHFTNTDLPIARRIANYIALVMSHHRLAEEVRVAAEATARASRLESTVRQLTEELDARSGYRRAIGESAHWREVLKKAAQVAAVETTVLLLGESGTGKEVIARFIHRGSAR